MSESETRVAMEMTGEAAGGSSQTPMATSTDKSKAFITQPRTGSGSKFSQISENYSLGMSTTLDGKCHTTTLVHSNSGRGETDFLVHSGSAEGDSGIDEEKESPREKMETLDKVYPLPSGWPQLQDKLFRRRALFFRKPMPPSISKAVEQLGLLQDRIEAWSREVELEIISRRSSMASAASSHQQPVRPATQATHSEGKVRKQLRFAADSERSDSSLTLGSSSHHVSPALPQGPAGRKTSAMSSFDLMVRGVGADMSEVGSLLDLEEEAVPHLGAEEVIDEVVTLLGRLEADRKDTDELYAKERVRVEWLQGKIDRISQKRLYELPRIVQQEHEACATDIAELKWHNSYRNRQKDRIRSQVENAEMLNGRLQEDIAFVEKHCPLVEEKLELERAAMSRIDEAQEQTEEEVNRTIEKLKRTENKSSEAHGKADKEREHIKKELESVREMLEEVKHELEAAKQLHVTYTSHCSDLRSKIKDAEQEKIVLETREENSRKSERLQSAKIKQVQDEIVEAEFEHRKLADNIATLSQKIDTLRREHRDLMSQLEATAKERLSLLRSKEQECKELIMTIEDMESKIKRCKKQKVSDAKNMERIKREMGKVETQLEVVNEEYTKIKVINVAVRNKLTGEEDKARAMEDSLQSTVDSLKKQLREETHNRTVLQARITADTTDLAKRQVEAKKKKAKVTLKATEMDDIVAGVLATTKALREKRASRQNTIGEIRQTMEDLKTEEEALREYTMKTKAELQPKYKQLMEEILNKQKRLDHMAHRTELINRKLAEMAQSEGIMNRVIKNTEEEIGEMSADVEEMTIQLETGHRQQQELQDSLDQVTGRIGKRDTGHLEHMAARREVLQGILGELKGELATNKGLAHDYRELQQHYLRIKEHSVNLLEKRTGLELSLKDHRELNSLQVRLHHALAHYFFIRGMYNQNELARFEELSAENENRIGELQGDMGDAITTISQFLNEQVDGTAARLVTAAASTALMEDMESDQRPQLLTALSIADHLKTPLTAPQLVRTPGAIQTH